MIYAGVRPARVRRAISLEGFGIPAEADDAAPAKLATWLDALREPPRFRPYASLGAVADRLQKDNPRLTRDKARVPRVALGARVARRPRASCAPIRATSCRSRPSTGSSESMAVWRAITAPVLWVAGSDSHDPGVARRAARRRGACRRPRRRAARAWPRSRDARLVVDPRRRPHAASRPARSGGARASKRSSTRRELAARDRIARAPRTRRCVVLTLMWGANWIVMKLALEQRAPGRRSTSQRTWLAIVVLFAVMAAMRTPLAPQATWTADRRHRRSSRRPSTSARRRWRSPAAARAARRCSCSRCRSGRW